MKLQKKRIDTNELDFSIQYYHTTMEFPDTLLVINGGPGQDYRYLLFNDAFERISKVANLIFFDQRGTGGSRAKTDSPSYDFAAQSKDIVRILENEGIDEVSILTHSWGGFLGLNFILENQNRIKKIFLVDTLGYHYDNAMNVAQEFFADEFSDLECKLTDASEDQAYKLLIANNTMMNFLDQSFSKPFLAHIGENPLNVEANEKTFQANMDLNLKDRLNELKKEIHILHGRFDLTVQNKYAIDLHHLIENSKLRIFEKSGHMPFIEEKEDFLAYILNNL